MGIYYHCFRSALLSASLLMFIYLKLMCSHFGSGKLTYKIVFFVVEKMMASSQLAHCEVNEKSFLLHSKMSTE